MTYAEFKALLPDSRVNEAEFNRLLMQAEAVIGDMIVYCVEEMTDKQKAAYDKALALQIDYFSEAGGATGDGLTSQNINGTSMTFGGGKFGEVNTNPVSVAALRNAGLTVRAYGWY